MSRIVRFPQRPPVPPRRQYEVFTIEDDSLNSLGIRACDDFVVAADEFRPGQYHACEQDSGVKVRKYYARPPNLIGRILPPHDAAEKCASVTSLFIEGTPLIWSADPGGNVTELEPRMCEAIFGRPVEFMLGYGFLMALAPDERVEAARTWGECVTRGTVYQNAFHTHRPDASSDPIGVIAMPYWDDDGRFGGWHGVTHTGEAIKVA